jgi:hypothetical protein
LGLRERDDKMRQLTIEEIELTGEVIEELERVSNEIVLWMSKVDNATRRVNVCSYSYSADFKSLKVQSDNVLVEYEDTYYQDTSDFYLYNLPFKCFTGGLDEFKAEFLQKVEDIKTEIEKKKADKERIRLEDERYEYERLKKKFEEV